MDKMELQKTEHPSKLLEQYSVRSTGNKITLANCLEEKNLIKLVRENGPIPVEAAVMLLVTQKMELFNVKFRLNETQISFIVDTFLEDFKSETLADLGLCLNNAAKGKYGTIYNVIDPPTLLSWFRTHLDQKAEAREQTKKAAKFGVDTHPKILETMKNAIATAETKREEAKGSRTNTRDEHIKILRYNFIKMDQATLEHYKKEFNTLNYERFYPGIITEIEKYIN